jgi:ElaB/YqjD/DUF883 family membrane-anchored ribosome-binding protein
VDEEPRTAGPQVDADGPRSPEAIEADIERTRQEVGDTVEALAAKTDVKARAQDRVEEVKANVHAKTDEVKAKARQVTPQTAQQGAGTVVAKVRENPVPLVAGGALLVAFLLGRRSARP